MTDTNINPEAQAHAEAAQAEADRLAAEAAAADTVQVRFLRPLGLAGKDYPVGVHAVPVSSFDEAEAAFYDQHVADGNVVEIVTADAPQDGRPTKVTRAPARKASKR